MRLPWRRHRRRCSLPSPDAKAAVEQAGRSLRDAEALTEHVVSVSARAASVARRADEVRARNHIAEAVTAAIRRA